MGACLHKKVEYGTERELDILGWEDTDSSELNKKRKLEDDQLERTYTHLPRFLAEKNRVRNSRRKEDRDSLRRKERRAAVKSKVEIKRSFRGSDFDKPMSFRDNVVDHELDDKKEERKSQNLQNTGVKLTSDYSNVSTHAIKVPSKSAFEHANADVLKLTSSSEINEDNPGIMI